VATKWNTHLQNIQVACVNGHYEGIFANTKHYYFHGHQCYLKGCHWLLWNVVQI
jgi:hypothetical protein